MASWLSLFKSGGAGNEIFDSAGQDRQLLARRFAAIISANLLNGIFFQDELMKKTSACILTVAIGFGGALLLEGPRAIAADPSPASPSPTTAETSLGQQILAKEREELDALKTGDFKAFGNLIADEAVFVDSLGPASKAEVLQHTEGFKLADYKIEDEKFLPISEDSGLISYYITEKGVSRGKDFTAHVYVSALWTKRATGWVCLFSQETATK